MSWEVIVEQPAFVLRRRGRFLVVALTGPAGVISTSAVNGGQRDGVRYLLNHQSCEGAGHRELHDLITAIGHDGYHRRTCDEAGLPPEQRAAIGLFYLEDMGVSETATALNVPAGTVKTRLMHARRKLRAVLEGDA